MKTGFAGYPTKAFPLLWMNRSTGNCLDLVEYSARLGLNLCEFSRSHFGLDSQEIDRIRIFGIDEKQDIELKRIGDGARLSGTTIVCAISDRWIPTSPNPEIRDAALSELHAMNTIGKAIGAELVLINPGYSHRSSKQSRARLISALKTQQRGGVQAGLIVTNFGIGDLQHVLDVCKETEAIPIIEISKVSTHTPTEFTGRLKAILDSVLEATDNPTIWARFAASSNRVVTDVSSGSPDYRSAMRVIGEFEDSTHSQVNLIVESPKREWDALLVRNYRAFMDQMGAEIDELSPEQIVSLNRPRVIGVGSTVRLKDLRLEELLEYRIVEPGLADPLLLRISSDSPVGSSLLGKEQGAVVEVNAPGGNYMYEVMDIM